MKYILSLFFATIILLTMSFNVFAGEIVNVNESLNVDVKYGMDESFLVNIPSDIVIQDGIGSFVLQAEDVFIESNSKLKIKINSDNFNGTWNLVDTSESTNKLAYDLSDENGSIISTTTALQVLSGEAYNSYISKLFSISVLDEMTKAGIYKDTLTFKVFVERKLAPGLYDENDNLIVHWDNTSLSQYIGVIDTIKEGGTYIKERWPQATKVVVHDDVNMIYQHNFYRNENIKEIILGDNITRLDYAAFDGSGIESFSWPESITTIDSETLAWVSLKSVYIPITVTKIQDFMFDENSNNVTIYYEGTEAQWNAIEKGEHWDKDYDFAEGEEVNVNVVFNYKK